MRGRSSMKTGMHYFLPECISNSYFSTIRVQVPRSLASPIARAATIGLVEATLVCVYSGGLPAPFHVAAFGQFALEKKVTTSAGGATSSRGIESRKTPNVLLKMELLDSLKIRNEAPGRESQVALIFKITYVILRRRFRLYLLSSVSIHICVLSMVHIQKRRIS